MGRKLENWLDSYLTYADETETALLFKKWCGISAIASCLQRKCFVRHEGMLYPNFYIVLVGPSGAARKGTAMRPVLELLSNITGVVLAPNSITPEALIKEMSMLSFSTIDPFNGLPTPHMSMTVFSQELAVFIREDDLGLIMTLTDWYDCPDLWEYKTKNMGTNSLKGVWVNMIGATTPRLLHKVLPQDAIGGGLSSRIVFVFGDRPDRLIPWPQMSKERLELKRKLIHDLDIIYMLDGEFKFTNEARDLYMDWYIAHSETPIFQQEELLPYLQRRAVHLIKLCMILSASSNDDMAITKQIFTQAVDLLNETERQMPKCFSSYGRLDVAAMFPRVIAVIQTRGVIPYGELLSLFYRDISKDELDQMLEVLTRIGVAKRTQAVGPNGRLVENVNYTKRTKVQEGTTGMGGVPGTESEGSNL